MHTRLGKTGVSHGQTVLRFRSRPSERRFNSDARVLSRRDQVSVSVLGADMFHAPHFPKWPGLVAVMHHTISQHRFLNAVLLRRLDIVPFPLCGSATVLFCFQRTTVAQWIQVVTAPLCNCTRSMYGGASTHRLSCRANIREHVVGSYFHC